MFCTNCGVKLQEGSAFCVSCGDRIVPDSPAAVESPADYYQQPPDLAPTEPLVEITEPTPSYEAPPPATEPPQQPVPETAPLAQEPSILSTSPNVVTLEPISRVYLDPPPQSDPQAGGSAAKTVGRTLLSILLAILAFVFTCVLIALLIVRPGNITEIIVNTDVAWIMEETGLDEIILEQVSESVLSDINIDIYDIEEFIKRETVSAEIGKIAEGYMRAILDGDMGFYMSSRDISNIIRAVAPDIREQFDYRITEEDIDEIVKTLDNQVDLQEFSVGRIMEDANVDLSIPGTLPGTLLTIYPLIVISILCALMLLDMFLLHRKKVRNAFLTASIPTMLSGFVYLIPGLLLSSLSSFFGDSVLSIITRFTGGIARLFLMHGLICFGLGIVFLVVCIVINVIAKDSLSKVNQASKTKVWLLTGLVANTALLAACAAISFLVYMNMI